MNNCVIADEEEITFPPTYRFERDTRDKYAYTKAKATGVRSLPVKVDPRVPTVKKLTCKDVAQAGFWPNVLNPLD